MQAADGKAEEIFFSIAARMMSDSSIPTVYDGMGNGRLPAYSFGNPDFYIMTKKNAEQMAVGLWNIFPDTVINPIIELDGE